MAALGSNMSNKGAKPSVLSDLNKDKKKSVKAKAKAKTAPKKGVKKTTTKATRAVPKAPTKKIVATKPAVKKTKASTPASAPKRVIKSRKPSSQTRKPVQKPSAALKPKKSLKRLPILRNAQLILEPSKRKKIRKIRVIMQGDLNINNVDAFRSEILPLFDQYDYIDFLQREVTSLDLCHIQLLYNFQAAPGLKGKTVTVDSDVSGDVKKLIVNAGFKELMFIPKLV